MGQDNMSFMVRATRADAANRRVSAERGLGLEWEAGLEVGPTQNA